MLVNRRSGFSLIELMVVMSLIAILLTVAAPGLRGFLASQAVKSTAYDLTADLLNARSEALKRSNTVTVTSVGGDWLKGWRVTATLPSGTLVVSEHSALDSSVVFTNMPTSITFDANGRVSTPTSQVRASLKSSIEGSGLERCVELDLSGRARSAVGACS